MEHATKIISEDGGKVFLRNIDKYVPKYTTSHPIIWQYSSITRASKID
jgi:Neuraminidase (sialidase)